MKFRFLVGYTLILVAIIGYALYPVIQEANKPINKFIREAKNSGSIPLVQFVIDEIQMEIANKVIDNFNKTSPIKVSGNSFMSTKENLEFIEKFQSSVPGYVIFDADGNIAFRGKGVVDLRNLNSIISNVHMH